MIEDVKKMTTTTWPPPTDATSRSTRVCVSCGREIGMDINVCPYCGHDYRFISAPPAKPRSSKPVAAGALTIIAGVMALVMAVSFILIDASDLERLDTEIFAESEITPADLADILEICGAIGIVFGAIAIIGGVFALMRKHFALAIVGAVFGLLGMGYIIGAVLSLVALVLILMSRSEFE